MAELTEAMRQWGDYHYISTLNKICVGVVDNEVEKLFLSRFLTKDNLLYPKYAVNMFSENSHVFDYNDLINPTK